MKKYKYTSLVIAMAVLLITGSCKKTLDINKSPNAPVDVPIDVLYTTSAVNIGFMGGADQNKFSLLIMQQYGGQTTGGQTQTQAWEQYLILPSDISNSWGAFYTTTLINLSLVIQKAAATSPHYSGVAKLLTAYTYGIMVDTWGKIPYSEALKTTAVPQPHYDDDKTIYASLLTMIDDGIADINKPTSTFDPIAASPIYPGDFATTKAQWIKFGNTLKLRLLLHTVKVDASAAGKIDALIASGNFFASNDDNFVGAFFNTAGAQNPIYQFDQNRAGYIVANNTIVSIMNSTNDPRRVTYFTQFPAGSGKYVGSVGGSDPSENYSTLGTYLEGTDGSAPIRMLTFAEYNFIRAEAALKYGGAGNAQSFFQAGITASMKDAGVADVDIATYITAHGTLTGSADAQLKSIITEKYIANFGVTTEPWTDFRRTGYPAITPPSNAVEPAVPRSLFYPQSEIDVNPNAKQKANQQVKVFWDAQ